MNSKRRDGEQYGEADELPDDLILKIISKLPFPNVLKARGLSKKWASFFSSNSHHHPEVRAFQELMTSQASRSWPSLTPVLIQGNSLLGYDIRGETWVRIAIPRLEGPAMEEMADSHVLVAGSMICWIQNHSKGLKSRKIVVMNIITGAQKVLHFSLTHQMPMLLNGRVFHSLPDGFIIVLLHQRQKTSDNCQLFVHTYDSRRGAWDENRVNAGHLSPLHSAVVCGGLVQDRKLGLSFGREYSRETPMSVEYDIASQEWFETGVFHALLQRERGLHWDQLVSCPGRVFCVCSRRYTRDGAQGLKVDLIELIEPPDASSPPLRGVKPRWAYHLDAEEYSYDSTYASSDGERIYVRCGREGILGGWEVLAYM